jgi:ornithine lipid hydroxylase
MFLARRFAALLDSLIDSLLWPLLLTCAIGATALGFSLGHEQLAFNLTYFGLAASLFVLERLRPYETRWLPSDGQEFPDLSHTALTKLVAQAVVVFVGYAGVQQIASVPGSHGVLGGLAWPTSWPVYAQVALALVVAEFGLYWSHRLAHEWSILWPFHAVHHSVRKLWFLNTGRFHVVDAVKSMLFSSVLLLLAGAPREVMLWVGALTPYIGFLTHCNVRMRFGWLNYLFNTPHLHRWHHSMDLHEGNKNYGENLIVWDLVFGTWFDDPKRRPPADIGIREAMPGNFLGQLWVPFRWARYQAEETARLNRPGMECRAGR